MTAELLVIVPSRGRPQNIAALGAAWDATTTDQASLLVAVDDDDSTLDAYRDLDGVTWAVGPRERLGPTLNRLAVANAGDYRAIGFMGDDHRPRTSQWNVRLLATLDQLGGVGVAYGNDLIHGPNLPTAVVLSSAIVATLGYMVPPGLVHLFLDNFWRDLGQGLGRLAYVPEVVIEHVHPIAGKAAWDDGYREVNAGALYAADEATYRTYQATQFQADLARLRAAIPELAR